MSFKPVTLSAASVLMLASLVTPTLATDPAAFLPPGKVCEKTPDGASYVDRHKLMNWTVSQTWEGRVIPQDIWDLNRDGDVTYEEKLGVLFKLEVSEICSRGTCTEGDPEAIDTMRYSFLMAFDPKNQKRYLVVTSKGQPDAAWYDQAGDLRTVFDYKHASLRIQCLKKYEADKVVYGVPESEGKDAPDHSGLRVALNRDDLATERNELRELVPAKFSVTDDRQNDEWTWAVEGYAGYRHDWTSDEWMWSGNLIPFVHVVQKSSEDEEDEIDKLGFGLDTAFYQSFLGNVQGGIEYLTDSEAKLDILGGQLIWLPPFGRLPGSYIGHFIDIGDSGVQVKIRPRLTLHGGRIFDRGSVETISSKSNYLRGGPGIRIQLRGDKGGSFEDFEFSADAKYLFGIAGDKDDYYRLESSLNYFFPGQDHFSLGLSYAYGYQDETLEKEDLIEAVLGARF